MVDVVVNAVQLNLINENEAGFKLTLQANRSFEYFFEDGNLASTIVRTMMHSMSAINQAPVIHCASGDITIITLQSWANMITQNSSYDIVDIKFTFTSSVSEVLMEAYLSWFCNSYFEALKANNLSHTSSISDLIEKIQSYVEIISSSMTKKKWNNILKGARTIYYLYYDYRDKNCDEKSNDEFPDSTDQQTINSCIKFLQEYFEFISSVPENNGYYIGSNCQRLLLQTNRFEQSKIEEHIQLQFPEMREADSEYDIDTTRRPSFSLS